MRVKSQAVWRGFNQCCPHCGQGAIYKNYLKVADDCRACGEEFSAQRADDAPPYFTILIVGHIIIPLMWLVETRYGPPIWVHMLIWLPAITLLSLWLLPRVKGAVIGLQWAMGLGEFGPPSKFNDRSI